MTKDRESRRDKNREDKLLHHRLDKLVKEEARTNKKVGFTYTSYFFIQSEYVQLSNVVKPKPGGSSRSWDKDRERSRYTTTRSGGSSTSKKRDADFSKTFPIKKKRRKTTKHTKHDKSDNNKEDKKLHRGENLSSDLDRVDDLENSQPCFKRSWVLGLFSLLSPDLDYCYLLYHIS